MDSETKCALQAAVGEALGQDVSDVGRVRREPLDYDAFLAHRTVSRLQGEAVVNHKRVPWSLIEKRTEGPELANPYLLDNGRRELNAYRSGLLDDIAPGVRSPHIYGTLLDSSGGITLWLEEVRHEGARPLDEGTILSAAHDLGGMSGRWAGCTVDEPWYFRGWIDRHAQPEAVVRGLATLRRPHPGALARLGDGVALTEQLILSQSRVREILESLPHTLCHHDAVGANIFHADGRTVLIDWESVGPGPVGADLASLLFSSVRRGDASASTVAPLVDDAVHSYAEAARAEAPTMQFEDVRRGFDAAIALRWKLVVDVVASIGREETPRRGSRPEEAPEDALDELTLLIEMLLRSAGRVLE